MTRLRTTLTAALVGVLLATTAGCKDDKQPSGNTTHVSVQDPGSQYQCKMTLTMGKPVKHQLIATLDVSCNFVALSAKSSLVIQGRVHGSGEGAWDNVDDPIPSILIPPVSLTFKAICLPGHDMQASASIDGVRPDGTPFHANQTTTPHAYTEQECNQ